jgi:anti-anti-sigma factor
MEITKTQENGKITITVEGKIGTNTSQQFQETLLPALDEANEVVLDFSGVAYIASAGLRVLLMGHKTASSKNGSMMLINVSEEVMEVLDMTGFSDMLTIM